ncbi:hypothetical protein OGM63_01900 [Plectonema radiosum NIES-515]|uniref:Uncharacterized protein n=1 Tax=Plectonema radiosum NIES-515 TaxID=2986073 RepID=A0ABT3AT44_9CYAN|nr:hypothetical protein [Plectonema radiosum]MCV3212292.1 hypothetical protein [Plectonema radiosum NIES-515]
MLKTLLLSGWFRVKPFTKYVVVMLFIAPLVAGSGHSSSAKQSQVAQITPVSGDSDSESVEMAAVDPQLSPISDKTQLLTAENNSLSNQELTVDPLAAVELAPLIKEEASTPDPLAAVELAPLTSESASQSNLVERLKAGKLKSWTSEDSVIAIDKPADELLDAATISPATTRSQPNTTNINVDPKPDESQTAQTDPIGSPYPIPWQWIQSTQEAMSSKGGGVRYYRSVPIVSPDGKYTVYSRIQLEVKPQMHNSRVSSVLFIEDRQTKNLRVVSSTSYNRDALLNVKVSSPDANGEGTIGVLVPVSWSQKGDRFLARRFEAVFNTSDASDSAVIWDRQKNNTNTVAPGNLENAGSNEQEHDKISVLLGWSKTQPDNVMFRTGELGDENWPLVTVSSDGKTDAATDIDQPTTYGEQVTQVWADPQVAYR